MCGRFVAVSSPALLAAHFGVSEVRAEQHQPSYNVAPRAEVPVIREGKERRVLSTMRWGLVPSWAGDPSIGDRCINARAEGIADRPAFKHAFVHRRCIIPADAFYEWQRLPSATGSRQPRKQPVLVHRRDGQPMAFAGLWEVWRVPEADPQQETSWLRTCSIVTTSANGLLAPIHDRMPAMLAERDWSRWLDPDEREVGALAAMLAPAPEDFLDAYLVSERVNRADNDDPELIRRVEPDTLF